jgi:hypothetical protein
LPGFRPVKLDLAIAEPGFCGFCARDSGRLWIGRSGLWKMKLSWR